MAERENDGDVITIEDSFIWVNHILAEEMEDPIHSSTTDAVANVAQQNVDGEENINIEEKRTSDDVRELLVEQQYWEKHAQISKKLNSSKTKYTSRQKLTQRDLDMTAYQKARSPTWYQFDKSTTLILKMLRDKNIVGDFHNIIGCGKNSVVIHANWRASALSNYGLGVAVKVYKLRNDTKHNDAILKRVQNEYKHLIMVQEQMYNIPRPVYKCRNVIATLFLGRDQETAPSLASLPNAHAGKINGKMYNILVRDLYKLYNDIHLVHGKLSTKNILYYGDNPYYIGWAHSVNRDHPMALRKLMRDCHFITEFFEKRGVPVVTKEELFKNVTGHDSRNIRALNAISRRDMWQGQLTNPNKNVDNSNDEPRPNCRFKSICKIDLI